MFQQHPVQLELLFYFCLDGDGTIIMTWLFSQIQWFTFSFSRGGYKIALCANWDSDQLGGTFAFMVELMLP